MTARWRAAITIAAGLVVLTGPAARAADEPPTVRIAGYRYEPANLTVLAGTTVQWVNEDVAGHDVSVVSGPTMLTSPELGQGEMWHATLTLPGLYQYVCTIHPEMTASVTVTAPTTSTTSSATTDTTAAVASTSTSTSTSTTTFTSIAGAAAIAEPSAPLRPLVRIAAFSAIVVALSFWLLGRRRDA